LDHKHERQLTWFLSMPVLGILILLGFVPLTWPVLARYEGQYFPVIKNVNVEIIEEVRNGLDVDVTFDKVRQCEFIGMSWYDTFGDRLQILFEINGEENLPVTRPVREDQDAGPWRLLGIDNLDGSVAITSHRCHPLWITYTRFYP